MSVENLIARLEGVKRTGHGRWLAKCPAHEDRTASLSIREMDVGRVLMHDFAGCDVESVLSAVGCTFDDIFPLREISNGKPIRRPFNSIDILRAVAFEVLVVAVAASHLASTRVALGEQDFERLMVSAERLQKAAEVANA